MDDINRAVEVADTAVATTPPDHPSRAGRLNNLGTMRFERTRVMDDLNRTINAVDMAVAAIPLDHPNRAVILNTLGTLLSRGFEQTRVKRDIERSLLSFREGWNCQNARPTIRINLARHAATLLASQSSWKRVSAECSRTSPNCELTMAAAY
jgi:hypothetical protein